MPRYMLLLHGDQDSEAGILPSKDTLSQMHAYNAEIVSAGALLAGEGLHPTSKGARVCFPPPTDPTTTTADITVTNGPFEAKRPVCGFWIIKAGGLEEAVGWVKKAPLKGTYVEVREIFESCDFPGMTEEMKMEEGWRVGAEGNK